MEPVRYEKLTYSVPEAAQVLGVSTAKMYQIVKMEDFPSIKLGGRVMIPIERLKNWLNEMTGGKHDGNYSK